MNSKWGVTVGCLAMALTGNMGAQSAQRATAVSGAMGVASSPAPAAEILREIDDPAAGYLWLVLRDPNHPAGPGRLVRAQRRTACQEKSCAPRQPVSQVELPVIHSGDAVTVEEHTPVLDMRLQAVALDPARKGGYFKARLKIGGKVARVMAVAPGHAVFGPESEVKP